MRKLIPLLALLMITPSQAKTEKDPWFEANKPVTCGPFREIVKNLMKDPVKETPIWIGKSSEDSTHFTLFYNPKTTTWTLVQYGSEIGCVLGMGNSSDIVDLSVLRQTY